MGLLSKKEFADECGITTRELAVYIGRGNVVVVDDLIDTTIQANSDFQQKKIDKKPGKKSASRTNVATSRTQKGNAETKEKPVDKAKLEEQRKRSEGVYQLATEKKQLDIEKIRRESALLEMKQRKLNGELVPTGLIKSLIISHTENIKNSYIDASENLIVIISQRKEMTALEISLIKKEFTQIINRALDSAVDTTRRTLKNIITEYSQTRGVGQHD